MFTHIFFFHTGAQGEERSSCADGTVEPPLGVPARHPPTCRVAAAFAPHSAQSARTRACGVRACCIAAFSALASPSRAICASHGRFTSSRPGVRRSSPRPLAPSVDAISERRGGDPAAVPSTCVGWAIRLLFGLEGAAPERSSAQKGLLPAPCQKGQKHPNFDEKVSCSLFMVCFGV